MSHNFFLLCSVSDQFHTDFVRGLSWETNNILLSCGWDGKLHRHSFEGIPIESTTVSIEVPMEDIVGKENCSDKHDNCTMEVTEQHKGIKNGIIRDRIIKSNCD